MSSSSSCHSTVMDSDVYTVPRFGWKANLDFQFPSRRSQTIRAKLKQILPMISLFIRYLIYTITLWLKGRKVLMDFVHPIQDDNRSGVPLGGIGGGTVGRGFRGEFCRFQILPGMYEYNVVSANQFILTVQNMENVTVYQTVLSVQSKPKRALSSWSWDFPGSQAEYTALYPRSWTVFNIPEHGLKLICRQVSPVIPHNYKDSCIPSAVFIWTIINNSVEDKNVSITFTLKNGTGGKDDKCGTVSSKLFSTCDDSNVASGVLINQKITGIPYSYAVATLEKEDVFVSRCCYFDPNGDGRTIWDALRKTGELISNTSEYSTREGDELGCGVCAKTQLLGDSVKSFAFSWAWDMPNIKFPFKRKQHKRYYTKYFGDTGKAGPDICLYSLTHYNDWELEIYNWQKIILNDMTLPDWYKSALFNETYYIADGGTLWLLCDESENLPAEDPRKIYGRFAYLEGHEYRMYNTYDVHFYASFALALLWPHLQTCVQYDIRDSVDKEDRSMYWFLYSGKHDYRKKKGSVPHDLGDPDEEPFKLINAYPIHDVSEWRDLNLKFVLQVYRDYNMHNNLEYVKDMFPQIITVVEHALTWDYDNDGMIENSGTPDQTYDAWIMTGTSSYCGSLWVATLYAVVKMAALIEKPSEAKKYESLFERAKLAFDKKLWNGQYYNFDCSGGSHSSSIMADQLCGLWYLRSSKVDIEIFPNKNVQSALKTIYDFNVKQYYNGSQGAVNGMMPDGKIDVFAVQSEEVWTGVTYALASLMIHEGMTAEGFITAKGIYDTVYEKSGLGFSTPEALHDLKSYRSVGYMRPLSIWSIQAALVRKAQVEKQ